MATYGAAIDPAHSSSERSLWQRPTTRRRRVHSCTRHCDTWPKIYLTDLMPPCRWTLSHCIVDSEVAAEELWASRPPAGFTECQESGRQMCFTLQVLRRVTASLAANMLRPSPRARNVQVHAVTTTDCTEGNRGPYITLRESHVSVYRMCFGEQ